MSHLAWILLGQSYPQTEYGMGWALTIGLVLLGAILIAIPRPRKTSLFSDERKKKAAGKKSPGKK